MAIITEQLYQEGGACLEQIVLKDENTAVTITPSKGGMITSITLDGEEFSWLRKPNFNLVERPRCGVPVLFPNCGLPDNGVHIFNGKAYPMENHGFADLLPWDVAGIDGNGVTLTLAPTALTKFLYPFDFGLSVTYSLCGNTVMITTEVENNGDVDMPFSLGFHPYFTASALENVTFDIKAKTCGNNPKAVQPKAPEVITLVKENGDSSVRQLTGVESPMVFTDRGNGHKVTVGFDDNFTNGVLWQQDAENFVCMEPWNGWPNSVNEEGKHEVLAPGESWTATWTITVEKE